MNTVDWLRTSNIWNPQKENIIFVHGYAGGDFAPPTLVMRDAFIRSDQYNFFMLEYGAVSRAPCYIQLVQNVKYVSRCIALNLRSLIKSGMQAKSLTCIGHSMGAHICGLIRRYLGFRLPKIIGKFGPIDIWIPYLWYTIQSSKRHLGTINK